MEKKKFIDEPTIVLETKLYKVGDCVKFESVILNGTGYTVWDSCIVTQIIDEKQRTYKIKDCKSQRTVQDQNWDKMKEINGINNVYYLEHLIPL